MSKETFFQHLSGTFASYRTELTDIQAELFLADVEASGITWEQAVKALALYRQSGEKFAPRAGQVIELVKGSDADRASAQWLVVKEAIRWPGSTSNVVFDDPKTQSVVSQMGWPWLCENYRADVDGVWRKGFIDSYRACNGASFPKVCLGRYADNPTKMIGNPEKCEAIFRQGLPPAETRSVKELAAPVGELIKALTA